MTEVCVNKYKKYLNTHYYFRWDELKKNKKKQTKIQDYFCNTKTHIPISVHIWWQPSWAIYGTTNIH